MRLVALMVASVAALQPPKPPQAILFDIDGTLFDSDPVHLRAFQKILVEEGFNGGVEIDEAFFMKTISGRQNKLICRDIFQYCRGERRVLWSTGTTSNHSSTISFQGLLFLQLFLCFL